MDFMLQSFTSPLKPVESGQLFHNENCCTIFS